MHSVNIAALLLCLVLKQCNNVASASELVEHTAQSFKETLQSGKTSFIYFGKHVNPTIEAFLEQLDMSAHALEDYGILVCKVNCSKVSLETYCTGEEVMKKAYLFRGADVLRSFDIDTVFDVNAIVSHVLFTVLFNEVRYVHTPTELLTLQRVVKGKMDIVMGHIPVLGLSEHRALMEAAFVYGSKYQFVQTTGAPLLRHMGVADPVSVQARLWILHCSSVTRHSEPCPHTLMKKPLTTINIHTFLQLMAAPLLTEAAVDPDEVNVVYNHLNVPLLFLFSQSETLQLDRDMAQSVAWRLRGNVGVVLIHRDSPSVKTPLKYNTAYRLPHEEVRYFSLKNIEEVANLFSKQENDSEEEDEEDEEEPSLDVLDDEVAESVYRARGQTLDTDLVTELTEDTFRTAVAQGDLMVVLFYVKWNAVSMAFLQSYVEVADALEDVSDIELGSVDCGEWTVICSEENITSFPSVLLYRPGEDPQRYRGMLGSGSLYRFLLLSKLPCPVSLSSPSEVLSFMAGELYKTHPTLSPSRAVGLYAPTHTDVVVFEEAVKSLRGEILLGLFVHEEAERWASEHSVTLPALLVSHGPGVQHEAHSLRSSTAEELISFVQRATLDTFPELTVENLPRYLELEKPLLMLFVGEEESPETAQSLEEIRKVQSTTNLDTFLTCWIHLGRTPAGRSVLETYLGFVPPLPALVLSRLATGEVFHFSPERPLVAGNIIKWLQRIESDLEQPAGGISDEAWGPPVPFYDFLAVMDEEAPGYASQCTPKSTPKGKQRGFEVEQERNPAGQGETTPQIQKSPHTEL